MLHEYYNEDIPSTNKITREQKNKLAEQYLDEYTPDMLTHDISSRDFPTPLKYLTLHHCPPAAEYVLDSLANDLSLYEELLFREMVRISLQQMGV